MEKPAITDHPVQDSIRKRWSPRAFSEKPVTLEHLTAKIRETLKRPAAEKPQA